MLKNRSSTNSLVLFAIGSFVLFRSIPAVAQVTVPSYTIQDLGTLGGNWSSADSINDQGHVVGQSCTIINGNSHPFFYDGQMHDLTPNIAANQVAHASWINNSDDIVGHFTTTTLGAFTSQAAEWGHNHVMRFIPINLNKWASGLGNTSLITNINSEATCINDRGDIVGDAWFSNFNRAFLYNDSKGTQTLDGTMLTPWGRDSYARFINNLGQAIVDIDYTSYIIASGDPPVTIPVLYNGLPVTSIGSYHISYYRSINSSGQIAVGCHPDNSSSGNFGGIVDNGIGVLLPTTNDNAIWAMNEAGDCIGEFYDGSGEPFVSIHNNIIPLGAAISRGSGWTLTSVTGINNKGQICGTGYLDNGQMHAFLLTPIRPEQAVLRITSTKMVSSHVLQVTTARTFGSAMHKVTISLGLTGANGQPISQSAVLPSSLNATTGDSPFLIDFKANMVPLFTDNVTFSVKATVQMEDGTSVQADTVPMVIPLPVVHIHGMASDNEDRIPTLLFSKLYHDHPSYTEDDGDARDQHSFTPAHNAIHAIYPTLVSFDYASFTEPMSVYGQSLSNYIRVEILPNTYAAKVNIVAHSMGGIVARDMIANGNDKLVHKLILVGSPTEGAADIAVLRAYQYSWQTLAVIVNHTPLRSTYFVKSYCLPMFHALENAGDVRRVANLQEMCPTYPWYSLRPTSDPSKRVSPQDNRNGYLENLNRIGLSKNIYYYAIWAGNFQEPVVGGNLTLEGLWGHPIQWGFQMFNVNALAQVGSGDGCVPTRSETAADTSWLKLGRNEPPQPGALVEYDDVGNVFHTKYFEKDRVNQDVVDILWIPSAQK